MGQSGDIITTGNMYTEVLLLSLLVLSVTPMTPPAPTTHNLPVLFQFSHPTHNVAVYRGAELKAAIAAGLVGGFGGAGHPKTPAPPLPPPAPVVTVKPYVPPPPPPPPALNLLLEQCIQQCIAKHGQCPYNG